MSILPALASPGSVVPINKRELMILVNESGGPVEVVRALLVSDDLLQREAVVAGEIEPGQADLTVLTHPEAGGEQSLPQFLVSAPEEDVKDPTALVAVDRIWRHYFHHAAKVAQKSRVHFLATWVGFEVGLRNAIAIARAEELSINPGHCLVAPELADSRFSFSAIVDEWTAATNPLYKFIVLERARWDWLSEHEKWYCFSDDEIAAYTAKLMLLTRWSRVSAKKIL